MENLNFWLKHFKLMFAASFLKSLFLIEDETFEGTGFFGNDCKEIWP
jgi:hypothetical protein